MKVTMEFITFLAVTQYPKRSDFRKAGFLVALSWRGDSPPWWEKAHAVRKQA